jgi:hypothetical protein
MLKSSSHSQIAQEQRYNHDGANFAVRGMMAGQQRVNQHEGNGRRVADCSKILNLMPLVKCRRFRTMIEPVGHHLRDPSRHDQLWVDGVQ